jgi:hypothetical protein
MKTLLVENGTQALTVVQTIVMAVLMVGLVLLVYLQYCEMRDREKRNRK